MINILVKERYNENRKCLIYSNKEFKKILKYERKRTDREGGIFSVLMLYIKNDEVHLNNLMKKIPNYLRDIDLMGWLDDICLGILLPAYDQNVALDFCHEMLNNKDVKTNIFAYKVHTYPKDWNLFSQNSHLIDKELNIHNEFQKVFKKKILKNLDHHIISAVVVKVPLWKRVLDVTASGIGLLLLSPLIILISCYIKIFSPGPVFFIQKRVGYKGKIFNFYKFRTMHVSKSNDTVHNNYVSQLMSSDTPMVKLDKKNDPRIIKGGSFLRKSSIDELPQLINVFIGNMSLVGPRPCLPYEAEEYLQWHKNRFDILPGMTGLWQVSGKNDLTFKQMIRLDISYVENLSLLNDLIILFKTIPTVVGLMFDKALKKLKKNS